MKKCLINFQNGSLDKALNCFLNLHKLEQNWAEPLNKLATIKFMMGDYEGSLKDIRLTLQKEPRHFGAIAGLVQINFILKKYNEALANIPPFGSAVFFKEHKKLLLKLSKYS